MSRRRCRRDIFHFGRAFDVVDEAFFTSDMLSTLSTRRFSLLMCFRRCRRGIFHFRHAFDVVDEAFFISDMLSTLSMRHSPLRICFRRCRRNVFHFRRVIWSLFQVSLFFGYGFIDYSGLFGVFPSLFSSPAHSLRGRSGWRISILEIDKGAHAGIRFCFGGREIQIVLPVTYWSIVSHVVGSVL